MDIFGILKNLTSDKVSYKDLSEEDIKVINPFMLNRFLSMNKDFIDLVNYIQWIPYENKSSYYNIYLNILPKKSIWLQYMKSKVKGRNKDLLKLLAKKWECSQNEIEQYLNFLTKDEIKSELIELNLDDKEITKLLK